MLLLWCLQLLAEYDAPSRVIVKVTVLFGEKALGWASEPSFVLRAPTSHVAARCSLLVYLLYSNLTCVMRK
jgi:hypothetical protein